MYKNIKTYLYVNMRMYLCVNTRTHQYVHTKTHEHIYVYMRSWHIRRDTIFTEFRGWKLTISEDFVWRTHILLLDPRDSYVALLLRMTLITHLHFYICVYCLIYALPQHHITTSGIVMPMNNAWPLINAGKAQEPMDSWAFPFSSLCWMKHQRFRSRWMSDRR